MTAGLFVMPRGGYFVRKLVGPSPFARYEVMNARTRMAIVRTWSLREATAIAAGLDAERHTSHRRKRRVTLNRLWTINGVLALAEASYILTFR